MVRKVGEQECSGKVALELSKGLSAEQDGSE